MSLYDNHKKYHDAFQKLKDMQDDAHINNLKNKMHGQIYQFFQKHQKDGKVDISGINDKDLKKFTDQMFDEAKEHILKSYFSLSDDQVKSLDSIKSIDGQSMLEQMVTSAMGGLDKTRLFDMLKTKGQVRIENMYQEFGSLIPGYHTQFRVQDYVTKNLDTLEDKVGIEKYISTAKGHHPKALENVRPTEFKSTQEAHQGIIQMSQYLQNVDYDLKKYK